MDYLKELCKDLELDPDLEKSKEGNYHFPITEELTVEVKPLDPGVFFFSPICTFPEVKREELLIQLMKANLFGQGTLGSAIALDSEESLLTLSEALPYDMEYRAFKDALEDFANIVEFWRDNVDQHIEQAQGNIL